MSDLYVELRGSVYNSVRDIISADLPNYALFFDGFASSSSPCDTSYAHTRFVPVGAVTKETLHPKYYRQDYSLSVDIVGSLAHTDSDLVMRVATNLRDLLLQRASALDTASNIDITDVACNPVPAAAKSRWLVTAIYSVRFRRQS